MGDQPLDCGPPPLPPPRKCTLSLFLSYHLPSDALFPSSYIFFSDFFFPFLLSQPVFSILGNPPLPLGLSQCGCGWVCVAAPCEAEPQRRGQRCVSGSFGVFDVFTSDWGGGRPDLLYKVGTTF